MEGVGSFVFDFQNHLARPTPPLSAIEKFLLSSNDHTQKQIHTSVKNNDRIVSSNGLGEFSTSSGLIDDYAGRFSFVSLPDTSFDGGQPFGWTKEMKNIVGLKSEVKLKEKSTLSMEKKTKNGSSTTLIKGQWTEQEDRLLVKLVKENGVKKWSQIAHKMVGRAGKQCRERWHNHLRPDIKKDSWSEEEEIMLIEAHEKFGNRWAEIAKQIPGRSENAIKNHWNATKRRQTAGKMNKGACRGSKTQPSILQEYIRSKYMMDYSPPFTPTITSPAIVSTPSTNPSSQVSFTHSEPSESSYTDDSTLISHMYNDDELLFMGGLLENIYEEPYLESIVVDSKDGEGAFYYGHPQNSLVFGSSEQDAYNGYSPSLEVMSNCNYLAATSTNLNEVLLQENMAKEADTKASQMYSDLYLSYLFDRMAPSCEAGANYCENISSHDLPIDQPAAYNKKKEMDLIEMISTSQFSHQYIGENTYY
ncbi:hypothetical protein AQUCO_04500020v1 [Aquilegia coerulea]|uniref:Uncharacterized protein n=1 Tax=Aquilegia coerulea TaxID=218851 RepID=A0A2G5CLH5_AQUCA|nr:hypothetical protein AQUCO_04500020v1 [Aquilegia coerulea]